MPFPLGKLLSVALRQAAKPASTYLQKRAETNPWFRCKCIKLARIYHSLEHRLVHNFYDRSHHNYLKIPHLDEEKAIKLGTNLFGEAFVFSVAAGAIYMEYQRGVNKEMIKEQKISYRILTLEKELEILNNAIKEKTSQNSTYI